MGKACIIGMEFSTEIEVVADALTDMGFEVIEAFRGDFALVDSLKRVDLTIHLGSDWSLVGRSIQKQVRPEFDLIHSRVQSGFPVFGICYGAQLLARVLGGQNYRCEQPEIGWIDILPEAGYEYFGGRWLEWHYDGFVVPHDVKITAMNATGVQGVLGTRFAGVQFHPEANSRILQNWLESGGLKELESQGIDAECLYIDSGLSDEETQQRFRDFLVQVLNGIL
jgi:GMP synthase-like glutamine amidotransferase